MKLQNYINKKCLGMLFRDVIDVSTNHKRIEFESL